MRRFNQTVELSQSYGIEGTVIGKHGGRSNVSKLVNLFKRTRQLVSFAKGLGIDLAVSHNSYTHTLAGRLVGARVGTLMDYEGQPTKLLSPIVSPRKHCESSVPNTKAFIGTKALRSRSTFQDSVLIPILLSSLKDPVGCRMIGNWKKISW